MNNYAARLFVGLLTGLSCALILPEGAAWYSWAALYGIAMTIGLWFLYGMSASAKLTIAFLVISFVSLCVWIAAALTLDISFSSVVDYRGDSTRVVPRAPVFAVIGLAAAATSYLLQIFSGKFRSTGMEKDAP